MVVQRDYSWFLVSIRKWHIWLRFEFKLADMWIGWFWQRREHVLHIWICLVPCVPLHVQVVKESE